MTNYPWEQNTCYEPPPIRRAPIPMAWRIFLTLAAIVVVCSALAALTEI